LRSLARGHTELCIKVLAGICQNGDSESARVTAAGILLDRGWGKAPQAHTGPDGDGALRVTIRHIVDGQRDAPDAQVLELPESRVPKVGDGEGGEG
jgi:hypothetical protein